ncbi:ABC transporter substrate-binding protein [Roseomonas chloroacetimidivorans]|uniref:ABC transporter substrate-binding protein n=1 Tax=Roseomonas chloroacetimidivorans TaxID=1766656 RepID=UPI003C715964
MFRTLLAAGVAAILGATAASAQISGDVVRIGVLNDGTGLFQDTNGPGSVVAAGLAVEDFARTNPGLHVEVIQADHQNRPDVGSTVARRWLDVDGVDMIVDVPNSAVGLAVNTIARDTRMTFIASATVTSDLTGSACSPNTVQWVTDSYAIGRAAARAMMSRGGKNWYFLTVDYALGHAIQRDASEFIEANGGRVLGASRHPLGISDFSSFLQRARASRPDVIGIANASPEAGNALKQAAEFGVNRSVQMVAFLMFVNDVHAIGLPVAQGLTLVEAFYWDMDDRTRAFSARFLERMGRPPSANQAGVYSSTLAYLNAVARAGTDDAHRVVPEMKRVPVDDPLFGPTTIRADGRAVHAMHLFQVKTPEESRAPWDYYRLVQTIPGDQAFRPINEGNCPLVR